jgi:glycosyltransferase involved in cell wall biosynthesis
MNIHFITGSLRGGGAERVLILLANKFIEKYEVTIVTFKGDDAFTPSKEITRVKLHSGTIKNHTLRRFFHLLNFYKVKENRPDLIISFMPPISFVSILIAKRFKLNIIVSEHINHLKKGSLRDQFTRKYLYKFANFTTVLTQFDVDYYNKYGAKVVVMPNPCTYQNLKETVKRNKNIIAVGNLDRYHHKGFDNLIKLSAPILKSQNDWKLIIIGSGDEGLNILSHLAHKYDIQNKVVFTGFRNDIKEIMKQSEIFILPSRFEGLPMVLLEAMSQGMACIAYDCKTGPSDIIINEINGLLIEDQNMSSMQNGLIKLIEDSSLRDRLSFNAVKSVEKYSINNIGKMWDNLFQRLK